ncbi:MAG: hypothetical protein LUC90_07100, partial [Lachnospiraceae bacterium]|nr:hypothetical protein [Lachnospiraceae bacterium]
MITIKAPIELKSARVISSSSEAFGQRIMGNYQLMSAQINREDLLHVVMSPPEIYIDGGGSTSILQDTRIQNNRQTKLEVINNLLNRISVTEEVNLTYQDRVYITDVLHRLGVTNIQQFMKQLSLLKQETRNVRELTDLYWNNLEELNRTLEEYQNSSISQRQVQESYSSQERLYLHEDILNRLQTGAIYQILNNFYSLPAQNSPQVRGQELAFSEQQRMVSHILLNRLQTQTVGRQVPFVYRHENFYEENGPEETQVTQESVNSQITSAILLHLADSLYQSLSEKNIRSSQVWVHAENALYQTAENTLKRLSYHMSGPNVSAAARQEEPVQEIRTQEKELETLRELLSLRNQSEQVLWENQTVIPADGDGTREQREPVLLSYTETSSGEEQEASGGAGTQTPQKQQRAEIETPEREQKTAKETGSPSAALEKKTAGREQEMPLPEASQVSRPSIPTGKGTGTGEKREQEKSSVPETGLLPSAKPGSVILRETEAAQTAPAAPTQERTEILEQLFHQYLSIVYHSDDRTNVRMEPMELSLRQETERLEEPLLAETQTRTETGEERLDGNWKVTAEGQVQTTAPSSGERVHQEAQIFFGTEDKEETVPFGSEKIKEYIREETILREGGQQGGQESPMQLVFPEQEASEETALPDRPLNSSGQETVPPSSERTRETAEGRVDFSKSGIGQERTGQPIPEEKRSQVLEEALRGEYSPLVPQPGREMERPAREAVSLELTYRAEETPESEVQSAFEAKKEAAGLQEALTDRKVKEVLERQQGREEKKEKTPSETAPPSSDQKTEPELMEAQPGREFHYMNEILSQRISGAAPQQEFPQRPRQEGDHLTLIYQQGEEGSSQEPETVSQENQKQGQPSSTETKPTARDAAQSIRQTSERILRQMEDIRQGEAVKRTISPEESGKTVYFTADQTMPEAGKEPARGQEEELTGQGDTLQSVRMGDTYSTMSRREETNLYYSGQNEPRESSPVSETGEDPLMQELMEINRRNVENYERYQQLMTARLTQEQQREKGRKPASLKMREESLKALENPQLVREEHYQKETRDEKARSAVEQAMEELIPEQTRQIYEKVLQMQQERQSSPDQGAAQLNSSLQELMLDIRQTERENEVRTHE